MAGQYWQPAALSNAPVAYPGIPGVPVAVRPNPGGARMNTNAGRPFAPNPFGIPANTWTGPAPAPYYQAPVTEAGWGQYDVDNQRRTNATKAAAAAQNYNRYVQLRGGPAGVAGGAVMGGAGGYGALGGAGGGLGGGGAGAGGGGNNQLQSLIGSFQDAKNRANAANEARYQDILHGYQNRFETGMNQLQGMGQQESRDINEAYDKQRAAQQQDLIGRGLGNSTVLSTMNAGNDRERAAELGRLNERLRQQTIGTTAGLSGDELQFMERRTDDAPSYALLAQLAQGLGTAGPGGGAGGGGYGGGVGGAPAYDTYGVGYQAPMFGFGQNGGGWGGYGDNGSSYVAGSNRGAPPQIRRGPPLAPGTNTSQLGFAIRGNPTSSSTPGGYEQVLAQTLGDAFGGGLDPELQDSLSLSPTDFYNLYGYMPSTRSPF